MYHEFYQFRENPFNITADPDFFFSSVRHQEAVAHLEFGIRERRGIIVLTGEIGTGKTTVCRTLLGRLDPTVKTALILNPDFNEIELLRMILRDLGINSDAQDKYSLTQTLNHFLITETRRGHNVVIILDESQNLSIYQLEQIRLLSNLETEKHKILQIILVGQPELTAKLRLATLRQLKQRVGVRYHILPMEKSELAPYINHRLRVASADQTNPGVSFSEEAISAIFEFSKGTPRLINLICDRALLSGFVAETRVIDKNLVVRAARETV